nr:hypothetical protein [Gammaproteobacteria bacterium]
MSNASARDLPSGLASASRLLQGRWAELRRGKDVVIQHVKLLWLQRSDTIFLRFSLHKAARIGECLSPRK